MTYTANGIMETDCAPDTLRTPESQIPTYKPTVEEMIEGYRSLGMLERYRFIQLVLSVTHGK